MALSSPFKFLDAYNKEDKDIFFGRDDEIEQLYDLVFESNLTLIYGQSGTGKTSLLQCGLANRFAESDWFDIYIRRNEDINQSLLRSLQRYDVEDTSGGALRERLMKKRQGIRRVKSDDDQEENELIRVLRAVYKRYLKPIFLLFDQFEELFILGNEPEQQAFYESVAHILDTEPYCRVLLIMREEAIAELYDFERVVPQLFDKRLRVEPLGRAKAQEVIANTTAKFDIGLADAGMPAAIVDVLSEGQGRVELTYLQVFLDRLYQEAAAGSTNGITFRTEHIRQVGSIANVLRDFLDKQTTGIQQQLQKNHPSVSPTAVRKVLSAFVTLEGTKRPLAREEVRVANLSDEQIGFVVEQLEKNRILRFDESRYELAHDTLALQVANDRSADEIALLQIAKIVKDRFHVYDTTRTLLNANELQLIASFRTRLEEEKLLSSEEWAFVKKSAAANRRRRLALAATVVTIMAVLAAFALYSNRQRLIAQENLRAAQLAQEQEQAARYNEFVNAGNALMAQFRYSEAKENYEKALLFNEEGTEARDSIAAADAKSSDRERFEQLISEGDAFFNRNDNTLLVNARQKYQEALELGYDNSLARRKVQEVEGKLAIVFEEFKDSGDSFFNVGNTFGYTEALKKYRQAARIRPGDAYVQNRIRECQQLLGQQ